MANFTRSDLLALTQDGLTQLANAGLVKRALREQEAGQGPKIEEMDGACIVASYADGTITRLPAGKSPGDALCTCPASGMCRHRVSLVLAYQQAASQAQDDRVGAQQPVAWDPADFSMETVEATLAASARSELQRLLRQPVEIRLEPGVVPAATMPMATVRFLVPHDLAYARCDCVAGQQCAHIALAVQAFRLGRESGLRVVTVGTQAAVAEDVGTALQASVLRLVERLLQEGVVAGMSVYATLMEVALRAARDAGATWLELTLEALEQQVVAYAARSALYSEREVLSLVAELYARSHVQGAHGDVAGALGIGEAMETPMGTTRLISLGARVRTDGDGLRASVLLADTDTGSTLAFEKRFPPHEPGARLDPHAAPNLRFAPGLLVGGVARGQLLTAVARRRADGMLTLGAGRGGKTSLMPHAGRYDLPAPLRVTHIETLMERYKQMPPALIRPRHRVRDVHVFNVREVLGQAFSAGSQHWQAAAELDDDGGIVYLERSYDAGAPSALSVLFAAAHGHYGPVRQIAGPTWVRDGKVVCEPWAISADSLIVPDVDAAIHAVDPPLLPAGHETLALPEQIMRWQAEALHQGARNLARDFAVRGKALAVQARNAGYLESADRMEGWLAEPMGMQASVSFSELAMWLLCVAEE